MKLVRQLRRTQWMSARELQEIQLGKLRYLVEVALNETAGYADLTGLRRDWLPESLDDLQRLPLIDKDVLSEEREGLLNHRVPGGPIRYRTGGSSGQPLIFYFDKLRQAYDKAARIRAHEWWSLKLGDREAHVWNAPIELDRTGRAKRFRDALINERIFPASTLGPETIGPFVAALKRFHPRQIFGYPSAIETLCELSRSAGLRLADMPVRAVFTTGEVLYDHQRSLITESFGGAPVANGR
jgi:phenylacetate-CoA ligase